MDEDSVAWDDSFSVGFAPIDNQHKELVIMTNELFQGCKRGNTFADVAFMRTLRKTIEYAQSHFRTEEGYMMKAAYPDLPAHQTEHIEFAAEVIKLTKKFEEDKAEPVELARFLKAWLMNHIAVTDKRYTPYLAKL